MKIDSSSSGSAEATRNVNSELDVGHELPLTQMRGRSSRVQGRGGLRCGEMENDGLC